MDIIPLGRGRFYISQRLWDDKPVFEAAMEMMGIAGRWRKMSLDLITGDVLIEVLD